MVNAFATAGKKPVPVVGADTNAFIAQLLKGDPGAAVPNPAGHGRGDERGAGVAQGADHGPGEGKNPPQQTLLTPEVWDVEKSKETLEKNNFPDRDANYSAAVEVKPYTTYTPDQLFACKGPGE